MHDAAWAPDGSAFAVVAGFMPAQTLVFDSKYAHYSTRDVTVTFLARYAPAHPLLALLLARKSRTSVPAASVPGAVHQMLFTRHHRASTDAPEMVRRCKQVADLGAGPHNIVRFNAWGRFLALAGFGNLPGDLVFYERKADGKWKQLAATRCFLGYGFLSKALATCDLVVYECKADGKWKLLVATRVRPRMAAFIQNQDTTCVVGTSARPMISGTSWLPPGSCFHMNSLDETAENSVSETFIASARPTAGGSSWPPTRSGIRSVSCVESLIKTACLLRTRQPASRRAFDAAQHRLCTNQGRDACLWWQQSRQHGKQDMCLKDIRRANNGVTLEWAPDGRHLLTATLAPRLRVDNAFYVYRHDGTLIAQQRGEELLEALWLPAPAGALCFLRSALDVQHVCTSPDCPSSLFPVLQ